MLRLALQALTIVSIPLAQPLNRSKQSDEDSCSAPQRKRKRSVESNADASSEGLSAEDSSRPADAAAAENGRAAGSACAWADEAATDQATWNIERPAGLQEVVRWCTGQQTLPLLRCQLQARL